MFFQCLNVFFNGLLYKCTSLEDEIRDFGHWDMSLGEDHVYVL